MVPSTSARPQGPQALERYHLHLTTTTPPTLTPTQPWTALQNPLSYMKTRTPSHLPPAHPPLPPISSLTGPPPMINAPASTPVAPHATRDQRRSSHQLPIPIQTLRTLPLRLRTSYTPLVLTPTSPQPTTSSPHPQRPTHPRLTTRCTLPRLPSGSSTLGPVSCRLHPHPRDSHRLQHPRIGKIPNSPLSYKQKPRSHSVQNQENG